MPYLGRSSNFGVRSVFHYLPSAGDTSVSGADADGKTLAFADGNYIDVYLNGVKLKTGTDWLFFWTKLMMKWVAPGGIFKFFKSILKFWSNNFLSKFTHKGNSMNNGNLIKAIDFKKSIWLKLFIKLTFPLHNLINCKSGIKQINHFDVSDLPSKIAGYINNNPEDENYFKINETKIW